MKRYKTVDEYIEGNGYWRGELELLRRMLLKTELQETLKWGMPVYTLRNKNVVGLGAFKSYVGLWFFQGVFLEDRHHVLINAQEGTTKGLRQWRFEGKEQIEEARVREYVQEAIENAREGREIRPEARQATAMPSELLQALDADERVRTSYYELSPGKQREYAEYISEARKEETRLRRLEKCIPLILEKRGLNNRYR